MTPPTSRRSGRPKLSETQRVSKRAEIAAAAAGLFETHGVAHISMRRIAAEVGCAPMTLYKYYDAKIDILRTLWGGVFDTLFGQLRTIAEGEHDAQRRLKRLCTAYVSFWLENPSLYRLVFMADGVTQPDVSVFIQGDDIAQHYNLFAAAIAAATATATAKGGDMTLIKTRSEALICFLHGIAHNRITMSGYDWPDLDGLVDMAIGGLDL